MPYLSRAIVKSLVGAVGAVAVNMKLRRLKSTNSDVWSLRCGEPVPDVTPVADTKPLCPGGSTASARTTPADAAAAGASTSAHVSERRRITARNVGPGGKLMRQCA